MGFFILAISAIVFFSKINSFPLRNWDEAWYSEIIKNMASGNYDLLMPFWNGRYYFDHAPLYFWLSTPVFKFFGPGEWQARIISVLSAIAATYLTFLIGKRLRNQQAGLISTFAFLTMGGVVVRFAHGNLDALLICFFLAAFYSFLKGSGNKIYYPICGALIGLGFLIKSWGIGLFPFSLIAIYTFIKDRKLYRHYPLIILFAILFSSWWYLWGVFKFGNQFINWYILNPSEGRLKTPLENFSFDYFQYYIRDVGIWLLIPILFIITHSKNIKKLDKTIIIPFTTLTLAFVTLLNFLSDKSGWYIIPALSLTSLVIGYLGNLLHESSRKLTIVIIFLIIIAQIINVFRIENIYPDRSNTGASLGLYARTIIPREQTIILNDQDFTSFLYYSNQIQIYTLENKTPKENEWWILNPQSLEIFLKKNPNSWIITPNTANLPLTNDKYEVAATHGDYSFVKMKSL